IGWGRWSLGVVLVALAQWLLVVARGRPANPLHRFLERYVRYTVHLTAYLFLAADPYPPFHGDTGYPVDVVTVEAVRQGRLGAAFRLVLCVPFLLLEGALTGGGIRWGPY